MLLPVEAPPDIPPQPQVVGRHIFYNASKFDGDNPAANRQDDAAIAPDKAALMPGQTATLANYTNYSCGINGIIIDVREMPQQVLLVADDFRFRVGNDENPMNWAAAPPPSTIAVRPGEGADGSDRVTILWDDNVIQRQWLQVTVLPTARTGLAEADVFYFGNAIGESGNSAADARVDAKDMLAVREARQTVVGPAPIDSNFDFNRDGRVDDADLAIVRSHQTHFLNVLKLIAVPAGAASTDHDPQ